MSAQPLSDITGLVANLTSVNTALEKQQDQIRDLKYAMVLVLIWVMAMAAFTAMVFFQR